MKMVDLQPITISVAYATDPIIPEINPKSIRIRLVM